MNKLLHWDAAVLLCIMSDMHVQCAYAPRSPEGEMIQPEMTGFIIPNSYLQILLKLKH